MRLHFQLSPNTQNVPFEYQHFLTGYFHRMLGDNDLHDGISLYSLGWLSGGVTMNNGKRSGGLDFPDGARWFVSAYDSELLHRVCINAQHNPDVCCGMQIKSIQISSGIQVERDRHIFKAASPILARSKEENGKVRHLIYSNEEADAVLTQTLRHKLDKAGLGEVASNTHVRFDRSYQNARTKLVKINGISNRASICPVVVEGPPEAIQFAWNVGAGHLTGSGFGALT